MARNPEITAQIRADFEASGMTKHEVARRLYGDPKRWREFDRYLKTVTPGPSAAVELARIFGKSETAYLAGTPLVEVARELGEANRLAASILARLQTLELAVTAGFEAIHLGNVALARRLAELEPQPRPAAEQRQRRGR